MNILKKRLNLEDRREPVFVDTGSRPCAPKAALSQDEAFNAPALFSPDVAISESAPEKKTPLVKRLFNFEDDWDRTHRLNPKTHAPYALDSDELLAENRETFRLSRFAAAGEIRPPARGYNFFKLTRFGRFTPMRGKYVRYNLDYSALQSSDDSDDVGFALNPATGLPMTSDDVGFALNPTTGLPMASDIGVDVAGNPYGTSLTSDFFGSGGIDNFSTSSFDSDFGHDAFDSFPSFNSDF